MSDTPLPATYGVRADGSIWLSFGDPHRGAHAQADFDFDEPIAKAVCRAVNSHDALVACLTWYVENDETNLGQEGNEFWEEGLKRAESALAAIGGRP